MAYICFEDLKEYMEDESDKLPYGFGEGLSQFRSPVLVEKILRTTDMKKTISGLSVKDFLLLGRSLQKYGYDCSRSLEIRNIWLAIQKERSTELEDFCITYGY